MDLAQHPPDRLRAADRHDRHALRGQVAPASRGERLERHLVAHALDEHERGCAIELNHRSRLWLAAGTRRLSHMGSFTHGDRRRR
jgi:hypothetical protein